MFLLSYIVLIKIWILASLHSGQSEECCLLHVLSTMQIHGANNLKHFDNYCYLICHLLCDVHLCCREVQLMFSVSH